MSKRKISFKKLCKYCFESNNCRDCILRGQGCGKPFRVFLQKHIIKIEDEIELISKSIEAIDKGDASPCDFINKNTGDFMLSRDLGEVELDFDIKAKI